MRSLGSGDACSATVAASSIAICRGAQSNRTHRRSGLEWKSLKLACGSELDFEAAISELTQLPARHRVVHGDHGTRCCTTARGPGLEGGLSALQRELRETVWIVDCVACEQGRRAKGTRQLQRRQHASLLLRAATAADGLVVRSIPIACPLRCLMWTSVRSCGPTRPKG